MDVRGLTLEISAIQLLCKVSVWPHLLATSVVLLNSAGDFWVCSGVLWVFFGEKHLKGETSINLFRNSDRNARNWRSWSIFEKKEKRRRTYDVNLLRNLKMRSEKNQTKSSFSMPASKAGACKIDVWHRKCGFIVVYMQGCRIDKFSQYPKCEESPTPNPALLFLCFSSEHLQE